MKVLIISHNCFNTSNNMGKTMISLFSQFNKSEICQFYIHGTLPNVIKCNSYYRVTDKDSLKGIFKLKTKGTIISNTIIKENNLVEKMYSFKNKISFMKKTIRDLIWQLSPWFNSDLKSWLEEEKPTHIFIAPGPNIFFYKIALKFIKYLNLPVITYICDDYYFLESKYGLFEKMYTKKLINVAKKIFNKSNDIITICDELSNSYEKYFGVKCTKIMTGIELNNTISNCYKNDIQNVSYMGNLSYKRYLNLYDIGKTIDKINENYNKNIKFNIYTNIEHVEIKKLLEEAKSINIKNFVIGDEYIKAKKETDLFIHSESFEPDCIDLVKSSISTKIPECLTSGKAFLAYGPDTVASINYLKTNNCAFVANDKEQLEKCLIEIIFNQEKRKEIISKALMIGKKNHDSLKNSKKLYNIIKNII